LLTAVYVAISDPIFFTEMAHQTIWLKQLRPIAKSEAVVGHLPEGKFGRVECFIAEKAFSERDRMAALRC
jgi:hypothetical protein